jgi:hypothetical protein
MIIVLFWYILSRCSVLTELDIIFVLMYKETSCGSRVCT